MKKLILLLLCMVLGCGCHIHTYSAPGIDLSQYKDVFIIEYGDERFHDCKDLVDVWYGVTYEGDTVELKTVQRPCTEYIYSPKKEIKL